MNRDRINTDFMDLVEIAMSHVRDERTRYQIVMLERSFKEHLEEQEVNPYGTGCS